IVEAGDVREVHHFALLIGFGASAINPYLTFETLMDIDAKQRYSSHAATPDAIPNYIKSIKKGLLKIFSKMGISTLQSYQGAQIFEAVGIDHDVVARYFTGTPSRIQGVGLAEIAAESIQRHDDAYAAKHAGRNRLGNDGYYHWRHGG